MSIKVGEKYISFLVSPSFKMIFIVLIFLHLVHCNSLGNYWQLRQELISSEATNRLGYVIPLNNKEEIVNNYLRKIKDEEFTEGLKNSSKFLGSRHFFDVRDDIKKSEVFKLIQNVPKGGLLHVHEPALASSEVMFDMTKHDDLYICNNTGKLHFKFYNESDQTCDWKLLSDLRPNEELDQSIMKAISMFGNRDNHDINSIWNHFEEIFNTIGPIVEYKPVFEKYYKRALQEIYDDNIMYIEIRGTFSYIFDVSGETYDSIMVAGLINDIVEDFKKTHPNFFGMRFIYAPQRTIDNATLEFHINQALEINRMFPNLVVGFDLIGQEDTGNRLLKYIEHFRNIPLKLYFHGGETNWFGLTDENLIDAVLLGTKRIGHGYALLKHPKILELLKERHIAIEVCPISNQVLKLVNDLRNHPGASYLANNYNVVIANDDPGIWGARGLSYDWYFAFMAFGHKDDDLRLLKKLALNSIEFSGLDIKNKFLLKKQWEENWNNFIDYMLLRI